MGYFQFLKSNAPWLGAAALMTFSSSYGQTFFISIFAGDIRAEFGLSHGDWGLLYTVATTISALVMFWAGTLTDRFRARQLGSAVLVLLAVACLGMALVTDVWMLVLVIFALRLTGQGMMSQIGMVATARWFVNTRGRALSVASLGFSFGNAVLPILFVAMLGVLDWRLLWVAAAAMALLAIPVLSVLLARERTPQSMENGQQSAGMNGAQWQRTELLRHWLFWLLVPTMLGPAAWSTSFFFQQVHLADVKGWSHLELVSLFPIYTVTLVCMTIATGWLVDRYQANRVMAVYMVPFVFAFLVLARADTPLGAALGLVFLGVAGGIGNTMVAAFWADHCGTRHLGSIKALIAAVMVFGSAIGPGVTGWAIDQGVDYPDQMQWIALYFVIAAVLAIVATVKARPLLPVAPQVDV